MTMENGQWENSQETLEAYRPSLLFSSPHRPREEGHTYSPCPGPTMGTQAKQTENRKTRAKTRLTFPTKSCKNDRTPTPLPILEHKQREEMIGVQKDILPKIFLQLGEIKSALEALALYHKSLKPEQTECQTECQTNLS